MQLKKSQYTTLLRFAFLPPSVMEFASRKYHFDHLEAYLQFSFEKNMKCSRIVENDNHVFFNTGLQNTAGDFLYAFFIPNENKRQKWALRYIASASELQITAATDPPVCTPQDFERDFFDFAYAHSDKYQPLAVSFSTVQEAREHIRRVFKNAHQLGYIIYENNQAIFHTGVKIADNANAVFVHRDAQGAAIGAEIQGLNSFKRFKSMAPGTGDSVFMFTPVAARDGRLHRTFSFFWNKQSAAECKYQSIRYYGGNWLQGY